MDIKFEVIWETDLNEYLGKPVPEEALPPFDLYPVQVGSKEHSDIIAKQWNKWSEDIPNLRKAREKFRYPDLNSVSVGPDGSIFVGDAGRAAIWRLNPDGRVADSIVCKTTPEQRKAFLANKKGFQPEFFSSVDNLQVDKDGIIFFFDKVHSRVLRMTSRGRLTAHPASSSSRFTVDHMGRLWLSQWNGSIERLEFPEDEPPVVTSGLYWRQSEEGNRHHLDGGVHMVPGKDGLMHAVPDAAPFRLLTFEGQRWTSRIVRDPHCDQECDHGKIRPRPKQEGFSFSPLLLGLTIDRRRDRLFATNNGGGIDVLDSLGNYLGRTQPRYGQMHHSTFDSEGFLYDVDSSLSSRKSRIVKYAVSVVQ